MNQQDFDVLLNQLSVDVRTYAQGVPLAYKDFSTPKMTIDRDEVYPLIIANDWVGLKSYSELKLTEIETKLLSMQQHQGQINGFMQRLFILKNDFPIYYPAAETLVHWADLKSILELQFLNAAISQHESDAFLSKYAKRGGIKAYNHEKLQYNNLANLLNYAYERHLALYMYYSFCIVSAEYNIAVVTNSNLTINVSNKINSLGNNIKNKHYLLYESVKTKNVSNIILTCNSFDTWVTNKISSDIIPILSYCHQKRLMNNTNLVVDGRRAMKSGTLLQNLLFAKSTCKWVSWNAQWHKEFSLSNDLFTASNQLANTPIPLLGTPISIVRLNSNIQPYNNTDVVVEGIVQNLNILHLSATKVLSIAEITNVNGVTVRLTLPHFKLDSGGLTNGCYAKISGKFLLSNPENNGNPAISIDRMAIKDIAKTNWNAWLRYQLRDIYQPVSHNLGISFNFEPSNYGGVNPVKFDTSYSKPNLLTIKSNIF